MANLKYLREFVKVCDKQNIPYEVGLQTLENKVTQYLQRDLKNNKTINHFKLEEQYTRAINVIKEYYKKKNSLVKKND